MSKQINLYSPLFRKQRKVFTATAMVQALVLLAGMLALFYGYARYHAGGLERQAAEVDRRVKIAMQQLQAVPAGQVDLSDEKAVDARIAALAAKAAANEQLMTQTGGRRAAITSIRCARWRASASRASGSPRCSSQAKAASCP